MRPLTLPDADEYVRRPLQFRRYRHAEGGTGRWGRAGEHRQGSGDPYRALVISLAHLEESALLNAHK